MIDKDSVGGSNALPASALDRVDTVIAFWFVSAVQAGADLTVRHNGVKTAAIATVLQHQPINVDQAKVPR